MDILGLTVPMWRGEGEEAFCEAVLSCLKEKTPRGAQDEWLMHSQSPDCLTLGEHAAICVCVGVLVCIQVNAHSHICMCKSIKEGRCNVICMSLSPKVWFQFTRGRAASEASCYADPHSSPKRITGFAALSAHPDGIQGSFDSPEQALQLLCHPQISLT